jgi:hypothetical protein
MPFAKSFKLEVGQHSGHLSIMITFRNGILVSSAIAGLFSATIATAQTPGSSLPAGTGNVLNYPAGTQIYPGGTIVPPRSTPIFPSNTVRNGDGSTTYYYPNGTRVNTRGNSVSPSGTVLTPGSNGGLNLPVDRAPNPPLKLR